MKAIVVGMKPSTRDEADRGRRQGMKPIVVDEYRRRNSVRVRA